VVVPTGTATPWREAPYLGLVEPGYAVYIKDGWETGSADLLAEALRVDGVVRILSIALRVAEEAQLEPSWYGYADGRFDEVLCTVDGETLWGEEVDQVRPCVVATVYVRE
jgi:hypothetical protein